MTTRTRSSGLPASPRQVLAGWRGEVEARLAVLLPRPPSASADGVALAMHDSVLSHGKRLRPLLVLACGRGLGTSPAGLLDIACAVEMVHAASLVLDDMPCMDNASLRRGRPSVHVAHGEDVAMLAAVGLLSQAFGVVASASGLQGTVRARLVTVLSECIGPLGLVRGQWRDLHEGARSRDAGQIAEANHQKTGVLFAAAMEMAARSCGAAAAVPALRCAARDIGQAFQLRDDLLDGEPAPALVMKDRFKDTGKSTLVAVLGRDAAQRRLRAHLAQARASLRSAFGRDDEVLEALLELCFPAEVQDPACTVGARHAVLAAPGAFQMHAGAAP